MHNFINLFNPYIKEYTYPFNIRRITSRNEYPKNYKWTPKYEKKRLELLQMLVLKPTLAILDEIDSGLDADAIIHIADVLATYRKQNPQASFLIVSHQKKFLDNLKPDHINVMQQGAIIRSGDYSLIDQIELGGYDAG